MENNSYFNLVTRGWPFSVNFWIQFVLQVSISWKGVYYRPVLSFSFWLGRCYFQKLFCGRSCPQYVPVQGFDNMLFHWRYWICYGVTLNLFLAVNQTHSEEEAATLVQTLLNASLENMIWSYLYVPMNANMKDMNTCMVKRYWTNLLPSYGVCYNIVHTCLKCLECSVLKNDNYY